MNFYDTIVGMGYDIKERRIDKVSIEKKEEGFTTVIFFDVKNKLLLGYIAVLEPIIHLSQLSEYYAAYQHLQRDLKTLSDISKYDILYRR